MSASFEVAVPVILEHEGGFSNNIHDPGGATNYGISLRFLKRLGIDIDHDGDVDEKDIRAMTRAEAMVFYDTFFWEPGGFEAFADQGCATKMFDVAVNMGPRQADRLAFRACGVDGDTRYPPVDLVNAMVPLEWLKRMCFEQRRFYDHLVAEKPQLDVFHAGWLVRAAYPFHPAALATFS